MNYSSIGDLAMTFQNRRQNTEIKSDLQRLAQELASGKKHDTSSTVSGDYSPVVAIERSLRVLAAYATANAEAGLMTASMQNVLGTVQDLASPLAPALFTASSSGHTGLVSTTATDARLKMDGVVSALNTKIADRSLFAGAATDVLPLANSATILAELQTAVAAETTAAGIVAVVEDWFMAPGGGFETIGYQGSAADLSAFGIGDGENTTLTIRADDPAIRKTLTGLALAALSGEGMITVGLNERLALARTAGEKIMGSESDLAIVRANVGSVEQQIDSAAARNAAEVATFEIAKSDLTAIDPFKAATELEAVTAQLETLYTLTARLSRLSLSDYLR